MSTLKKCDICNKHNTCYVTTIRRLNEEIDFHNHSFLPRKPHVCTDCGGIFRKFIEEGFLPEFDIRTDFEVA